MNYSFLFILAASLGMSLSVSQAELAENHVHKLEKAFKRLDNMGKAMRVGGGNAQEVIHEMNGLTSFSNDWLHDFESFIRGDHDSGGSICCISEGKYLVAPEPSKIDLAADDIKDIHQQSLSTMLAEALAQSKDGKVVLEYTSASHINSHPANKPLGKGMMAVAWNSKALLKDKIKGWKEFYCYIPVEK